MIMRSYGSWHFKKKGVLALQIYLKVYSWPTRVDDGENPLYIPSNETLSLENLPLMFAGQSANDDA